jgi:site-specific DNA recombinase
MSEREASSTHYCISSALLQGRAKQAGTVSRIPADEVEALVAKSVRNHLNDSIGIADTVLAHNHIARVDVQSGQFVIELANAKAADRKHKRGRNVIEVPWRKTPSTRRREVLVPASASPQEFRPIRSENRALLVASIARGCRWLDELIADPAANTESIAKREECTARKVNMTISLAFLAPDLVKAAIDGRLPHGMDVARLCDLPVEWSRQRQMLGFIAQ